jgi:hypothetical protein
VGMSAAGAATLQECDAFPQALWCSMVFFMVFYGVPESKSMFFLVNSIG